MSKIITIFSILIVIALSTVFILKSSKSNTNLVTSSPIPTGESNNQEISAKFEIYTNGTKRIFTDAKYHNQSKVVYIEKSNPSTILVKKAGIKWTNFFETLPMKLTSTCLTTGTGQVFCTNETKKLKFLINGIENPSALEMTIQNGDFLQVVYN